LFSFARLSGDFLQPVFIACGRTAQYSLCSDTDPESVTRSLRPKEISRYGKFVTGATILLAVLLVIVFFVPYFADWIYLKFFIICGLALANLGILYYIRC
jgi:hypothetical protein